MDTILRCSKQHADIKCAKKKKITKTAYITNNNTHKVTRPDNSQMDMKPQS